jgi:hypothetical protein
MSSTEMSRRAVSVLDEAIFGMSMTVIGRRINVRKESCPVEVEGGIVDGAEWQSGHKPVAVGADTVAFECTPSGIPGSSQQAHVHLIWEEGIPILELVHLEELARDKVYKFSFIFFP